MGVNNVRILIPWSGIELADDFYYWDHGRLPRQRGRSRGMGILGVLNSTPAWAVEPGRPPMASPPGIDRGVCRVRRRGGGALRRQGVGLRGLERAERLLRSGIPSRIQPRTPSCCRRPTRRSRRPIRMPPSSAAWSRWVLDYGNLAISPDRFVDGMYAAGAQGYFDALSYHPYHYTVPFSQGRAHTAGTSVRSAQLELMHQSMVANGDGDKLIWATEYGQPSSQGGEVKQAASSQDFLNTWSHSRLHRSVVHLHDARSQHGEHRHPGHTRGVAHRLDTEAGRRGDPSVDGHASADGSGPGHAWRPPTHRSMQSAPTEATALPQEPAATETRHRSDRSDAHRSDRRRGNGLRRDGDHRNHADGPRNRC